MADILPFKGVLYNPEKVKDLSRVATPPYDVISPEEQERFYSRDKYNFIRLDLGKEFPEDTGRNNRYTRAADCLSGWRSDKILVQDNEPSIYFYELTYDIQGGLQKIMKGFIALCRLEDFKTGKIVPHEYTLSKPKSDRLNLLKACQANLSLIFSLYSSPNSRINSSIEKNIGSSAPGIDVFDDNNTRHRLWSVSDTAIIDLIKNEMKNNTVYIADGHHRYEASLNYRNELREKGATTGNENPSDYIMMYFANMDEPGLTVLPTHRLLYNLPESKVKRITEGLNSNFQLKYFPFSLNGESGARKQLLDAMKNAAPKEHLMGMYIKGDSRYILLSIKDEALMQKGSSAKPFAWRRLDVAILQSLILEDILGLSEESLKKQENLSYVKDIEEALQKVNSGKYQIAFLLNPTKIEEIRDVTGAGERMPQKSTYFYPKFFTGLVFYKF